MKKHQPIVFLILSNLILASSISVNLSFPLDTPKNSLLFNFTNNIPEYFSDLNLDISCSKERRIFTKIFSLKNDSLFLSDNFITNRTENLFIVTFRRSDFGLDYVLFNISTFPTQSKPILSQNIFRGVIPINSAPNSIVSGLTNAFFICQTDTKCFDSFSFSCESNFCPFELKLLRVTSRFYISAYAIETILNESFWRLNISIRNLNQNVTNFELIIDAIDDILRPVFKMTSLTFDFPETTAPGSFLFKPELSNYWSNNSYTFSLQSNIAAHFLNLDHKTCEIWLRAQFDGEFQSVILVSIEVRFVESISVTVIQSISTANFLINIIDVSEFAPIFSLPMYESTLCTDISTNQFIAYTPILYKDFTEKLSDLRIESNQNQSIRFQLELNHIWVGYVIQNVTGNHTGYFHTFNLFAYDSINRTLFSEALLVVRLTKCVKNAPIFYRNSIQLEISPNCPVYYQFSVFYDQTERLDSTFQIVGISNGCRMDSNGFLNCSNQMSVWEDLSVTAKGPNNLISHANVSFFHTGQNIFSSPVIHPIIQLNILKSSTQKIIFDFSNISYFEFYTISGFFQENSTFFIENSFLKLSSNPPIGIFNFEVLGMNYNFSIPFEVYFFKIEILSGFSTGNISLKIPFEPTNTSIYTFRPEYGAFSYHIKNNTNIPLAIDSHSGILYVTKRIREYSNFKFQVFARSVKISNLVQSIYVKVIFNSEFEIYSCPMDSRILVTLPKARNARIYSLAIHNQNNSITILGENRLFAISNSSIILKSPLSHSNSNSTLSILIRHYDYNNFTENICHFEVRFLNSTFLPLPTLPLTHNIKLPVCTPTNSHIFKLPTLHRGEYKFVPANLGLKILANGSLIYTGPRPAYTSIHQSIHLVIDFTEILFSTLNIEFVSPNFQNQLNFSVNSGTQIGTKIGGIWNQPQQPCTYFQIEYSDGEIPFHIDSVTGEIFVSSILTKAWFQFSVRVTQYCFRGNIDVIMKVVPNSFIEIFTREIYEITFQPSNSVQMIGQINTNPIFSAFELNLVANTSVFSEHFWIRNVFLFTSGIIQQIRSLILTVRACIPSTSVCNYAYIHLIIQQPKLFPPKFSQENVTIFIPSTQPIPSQIFQMTSYDLDGVFEALFFTFTTHSPHFNITASGSIFIQEHLPARITEIGIRVTDSSGAYSTSQVYMHIFTHFNHSNLFNTFYNISIDPILSPNFRISPLENVAYQYALLFTSPPNSLFVNNSPEIEIRNTLLERIETVLIIISTENFIIDSSYVQINLIHRNHAPEFPTAFVDIYIYTNTSLSSIFNIPSATDGDEGINGVITYSITHHSPIIAPLFTINTLNGSLTLTRNLTHFQFHTVNITIQASDQGTPPLYNDVIVMVNVQPAVTIQFETETITLYVTLPQTDTLFQLVPIGPVDDVIFMITLISPRRDFSVNNSGHIFATQPFHTLFAFRYSLTLQARLGLSTTEVSIHINVHFTFEFESETYQRVLPENTPTNQVIFNPGITTIVSTVQFHLEPLLREFTVNSTGHVILVTELDFESTQSYNITLSVYSHYLQQTIRTNLVLIVTDINDNSPTLLGQSPYMAHVFSFAFHLNIYQFIATDLDSGMNGVLTYSIFTASVLDLFNVSKDGLLSFRQLPNPFLDSYSVALTVSDGGTPPLVSNAILAISIHHVPPANLPIFEHDVYAIEIPEDFMDSDFPVSVIRAFSPLPIQYSILHNPSEFHVIIQANTQRIFIRNSLDFEMHQQFNVTVLANDTNSTQTCLIFINVLDVNDNSPIFKSQLYEASLNENNRIGDKVLTFIADDLDSGSNGDLSYFFGIENVTDFFYLSGNSLMAKVEFDFEEFQIFQFEIIARDNGFPSRSTSCFVVVNIVNLNDNTPIVLIGTTILNLAENATILSEILTIPGFDVDDIAPLAYTLQDGYSYFAVNNNTGMLYLVFTPLRGTYELYINISDGLYSTHFTIFILVGNVNENTPEINSSSCVGSLLENSTNNTFVGQISALDSDIGKNGEISYSIITNFHVINENFDGISPNVYQNVFKIDSKTGVITTNYDGTTLVGDVRTIIDAEFASLINLDVIARDGGGLEAFCRVEITVHDVNDNPPLFDREIYTVSIRQTLPDTYIQTVYAFDPDQGTNGAIKYNLEGRGLFKIEPNLGIITTYNIIPSGNYSVIAKAYDLGSPRLESSSTVIVYILSNILPRLEFSRFRYEVSIREDQALNAAIIQVNASTSSSNTQIFYSISPGRNFRGNSEAHFLMDGIKGEISVARTLDYERLRPGPFYFHFIVQATITENQVFAFVDISVTDVNDNSPTFLASRLRFYLSEGLSNGTFVGRLTASDMDSGNNSQIEYFLHELSLGIPFNVEIDGLITSREAFDYENPLGQIQYSFFAFARDKCQPTCSKSRSVYVVVNIIDLNDNKPIFLPNLTHSISLREDLKPRKGILEISATDLDQISQSVLVYSIKEGNVNYVFSIDEKNGRLNLDDSLDFEVTQSYELVIEVSDSDFSALHQLRVEIEDIDDSIPVFSRPKYEVEIMENVPIGTYLFQVFANDTDLPENSFIFYEISMFSSGSTFFDVDNRTGVIFTIFEIDRESYPIIEFFCFASDSNNNRGKTLIRAIVLDINEPPFFPKPLYTSSIPENGLVGGLVGYFPAIDRDNSSNAELEYSLIINPNTAFRVNSTSGHIFTNKSFDFELETSIRLVLQVLDHGSQPLSATASIKVNIEDMNDNNPYFSCSEMYVRIFDNVIVNSIISRVKIYDLDLIPIFSVTLLTHNIPFEIAPATGDVILKDSLNQSSYSLALVMYDHFLNHTQFGNLTISVLTLNRSPPKLTGSVNQFRVSSSAMKSTEIGTVTAMDTEDQILTFSIPGNNNIFNINPQTGIITLESELVPNSITSYNFTVIITDSGYPQLSTNVVVNISVYNSEENKLRFSQSYYSIEVLENELISNILQVEITNFSPVIFTIDESEYFSLNSSTGYLSLSNTLDYELQSSHNVSITANAENGMFGSSYVIVNVIDINDNPTMETFSTIYIHHSESEPLLVTIPFNDLDTNDVFQNCMFINGSTEFRIFPNCSLEVSSLTPFGAYFVDISGGDDDQKEPVINHLNMNINKLPTIRPNEVLSISLTNSTSETFKNIPYIESALYSILRLDITLFSIEEFSQGTLVHFYFDDVIDISTISYTIYRNRQVLSTNGVHLFSIGNDPCISEPCFNRGVCNSSIEIGPITTITSQQNLFIAPLISHSYECICAPGSTGTNCSINIDDCLYIRCENGGKCVDLLQDFFCECPEGVSGKFCEMAVNHCATNPCKNSGNCITSVSSYKCVCESGFYGANCEYSQSRPLNFCIETECRNNSICTATPTAHTCTCETGFKGPFCETPSVSGDPCNSNPCQFGGVCVTNATFPVGYRCLCPVGFSGPNCCYALDACELFPCKNGATCYNGFFGDYFCECLDGFGGENCEAMLSPCDVAQCHNGGRCQETGNGYTCSCPIGFVGDTCQLPTFPEDFCADSPCSDQSNCTSGHTNYTCTCYEGVSGELCHIATQLTSPCGANPCQYQGLCVENGTEFVCECLQGFRGKQCEININECATNACENGICVDGLGSYKCDCFEGYFGRNCSGKCPTGFGGIHCDVPLKLCTESSCEEGFQCRVLSDGFGCFCPDGFTGASCETRLNCGNVNCVNGGKCISDSRFGFKCNCPNAFSGEKCEIFSLSSFSGQSFIHFPGHLLPSQNGAISLQVFTPSENGIILFATNYFDSQNKEFIIIDIINSIIRLTLSFGAETYVLTDCNGQTLSNKEWHNISIAYTMDAISVCVDNCKEICTLKTDQTFHSIDGVISLFLGGLPLDPGLKLAPNFTGCLQEFKINNQPIDLNGGMHLNTIDGCVVEFMSPCEPINCQPQSSCVETVNEPICICNHGFFGSDCEELVESLNLGEGDFIQVVANNRIARSRRGTKNRIVRELTGLAVLLTSFSAAILPESESGLILDVSDGTRTLKLELTATHLELKTDNNSVSIIRTSSTNPWFQIGFVIVGNILTLRWNNFTTDLELNAFVTLNMELSAIYIGRRVDGFQGCIQDIRLNEFQLQKPNSPFRLVVSSEEPNSNSGCQTACSKSFCGFGDCVPSSANQNGYTCKCQDDSYRELCTEVDSTAIPAYVWVLLVLGFLLFVIVVVVVISAIYYGHNQFTNDDEKFYSVQVYENGSIAEDEFGFMRSHKREGGGEVGLTDNPYGEAKIVGEPSILSDEFNETKKFEQENFRSVMLRREAYLCDDDSNRQFSESESDEILTTSLSRDSELNMSQLVAIETIQELGSPFKQLGDVIYTQFDGSD